MSTELEKNVFTEHYTEVKPKKPEKSEKSEVLLSHVRQQLKRYKHQDAIDFAEHTRYYPQFVNENNQKLQKNKDYSIQTFQGESGIRAYYRVVLERPGKYVLSACHVNVHGHHRGDLRFIEVNDRTVTRGTEEYSVIGKLFLGDTVVVKELARLRPSSNQDVFDTTIDQNCVWMASKITVLTRNYLSRCKFSMLDVGAVVEEQNELMSTVANYDNLKPGKLYYADAFVPNKMVTHFTEDYPEEKYNELVLLCSKIHQPPNPQGTIFQVYQADDLTEIFDIGTSAFKKASRHGNQPTDIVETCVLMGYAAANSVGYGRLDTREFPIENPRRFGRTLQFHIDNPADKPTDGKWGVGNRIQIDGRTGESCAVIETVLAAQRSLKITARLSKDVHNKIKFDEGLHIVSQREPLDLQILKKGFFKQLPSETNARRIIEALYGGLTIRKKPVMGRSFTYPGKSPLKLNKYQAEYVEMLMEKTNPIIVGSSPFGCGKSMTIVTAAYEISKRDEAQQQLLITQSNFASVNLVEIASKIEDFRFVRYISEKNSKEMADDCLTDYDLPVLMKAVFEEWATHLTPTMLEQKHKFNILKYLLNNKIVQPVDLQGEALRAHNQLKKGNHSVFGCTQAFFALYRPHAIMVTADSLQTLLSYDVLKKKLVTSIQIDEASQLPEYTFIGLLTLFPNANYGLIGDIQQLPPYCETGLDGRLKDFGVGNTMERAVGDELFPQAMLREVYRCHPRTTELLSELFYKGKLISGVSEDSRSQYMLSRPDFWPNWRFPVMVVNNKVRGQRMGTSCGNKEEKEIVKKLVDILTAEYGNYQLDESEIGVISFYKAQTSVLMDALRCRQVKCGTVDSFQGTEREVIILCCTNEQISEFMQMGNRLNVAMSRAKQVTIIVGNMDGLRKAKYWGTIVEKAKKNGCVMEAISILNAPVSQTKRNRPQTQEKPRVAPKITLPNISESDALSRKMSEVRVSNSSARGPRPSTLARSASMYTTQQPTTTRTQHTATRPTVDPLGRIQQSNPYASGYSTYSPPRTTVTAPPTPRKEESLLTKICSFFGF
uniref:AAA_12 domain-containing protein n=1 Tax=Caenorhabditis tropicalis TaxID=1561998 RepID=A0A1I7U1J2_9PELO